MTCEEMISLKSFTIGVNRMFAARGGVMWEKVNDSQLRQYLISELERFNAQQGAAKKVMKAAITIGKQPDSDMYVLAEDIQVCRK